MKRRSLTPSPAIGMKNLLRGAAAPGRSQTTCPPGVIGLGTTNDVTFRRGDGSPTVSIRDVDATATQAAADAAQAQADAASAIASANGFAKVVHSTVAPGPDQAKTLPDGTTWFQHSGDLSGPTVGQWVLSGGNWVGYKVDGVAIANLDVGTETVGSLTASRLLIGGGGNLIVDPGFTAGEVWPIVAGFTRQATGGFTGAGSVVIAAQTAAASLPQSRAGYFPVQPGAVYQVAYYVSAATAGEKPVQVTLYQVDGSGAVSKAGSVTASPTTSFVQVTGQVPVGATAVKAFVAVETVGATKGTVTVSDLSARSATDGSLIVNGAIDGQTITGATVQSDQGPATGVKFDHNGIRAYDPTGVQTIDIDATTGGATFAGTFRTAAVGPRVEIDQGGEIDPITGQGSSACVRLYPRDEAVRGCGRIDVADDTGLMRIVGTAANSAGTAWSEIDIAPDGISTRLAGLTAPGCLSVLQGLATLSINGSKQTVLGVTGQGTPMPFAQSGSSIYPLAPQLRTPTMTVTSGWAFKSAEHISVAGLHVVRVMLTKKSGEVLSVGAYNPGSITSKGDYTTAYEVGGNWMAAGAVGGQASLSPGGALYLRVHAPSTTLPAVDYTFTFIWAAI